MVVRGGSGTSTSPWAVGTALKASCPIRSRAISRENRHRPVPTRTRIPARQPFGPLRRKGMLLAGLSVFGLSSLAGGLTGSPGQLIAARAVMGVGAAMGVSRDAVDADERVHRAAGARAGDWLVGRDHRHGDRAGADRRRLVASGVRLDHRLRATGWQHARDARRRDCRACVDSSHPLLPRSLRRRSPAVSRSPPVAIPPPGVLTSTAPVRRTPTRSGCGATCPTRLSRRRSASRT